MADLSKSKRKDHPLSMRLAERDMALIDRAARLRGRSRTDFVREAAVQSAEDVLMQHGLIRMTPTAFANFAAAIAAPGQAVPTMVELFRRNAPWEPVALSAAIADRD